MSFSNEPSAALRLELLVNEYLEQAERGESSPMEQWRARAGEQWDDFRASVGVAMSLDAAGELLGNYEVTMTIPETIERFEIVRLVAEGGFSRVFLGFDPKLMRTVALKVLKSSGAREANHSEALAREAHALAQVSSDYVVQILELIDSFESGIIVTEFIPGPTLEQVIGWLRDPSAAAPPSSELQRAQRAELETVADALADSAERARVALRIADGLAACHAKDVLHRDLKPSNILIPSVQRPKLIDFGLAHTDTSATMQLAGFTDTFVGTAAYLAPEQIDERRVGKSVKSEVYALGVLIYESIALEHPWAYGIQRPGLTPPPHPLISRKVKWTLDKALSLKPEDRYKSVADFAMDIRRALDGDGTLEAAPSLIRRGCELTGAMLPFSLRTAALGSVLLLGAGRQAREYRSRSATLTDVMVLTEDITQVGSPAAASTVLDRIDSLAAASQHADGDWLFRWLLPPVGPKVAQIEAQTMARIEQLVGAETQQAMQISLLVSRKSVVNAIKANWSGPMARAFGPARVTRCKLVTDETVTVHKFGSKFPQTLKPVARSTGQAALLSPGHYRAQSSVTGEECDFEVLQNQLIAAPDLRPIHEKLVGQLIAIPSPAEPGAPATFQILSEDITESTLFQLLTEEDLETYRSGASIVAPGPSGSSDPGALRSSGFFSEFAAARLGMRLPTHAELLAARAHGSLELHESERVRICYWCSKKGGDGLNAALVCFHRGDGDWPESAIIEISPRRDGYIGIGRLRLVRTVSPADK